MKPGIMRTEDFPRRLHTAHGTSFSCNLSNPDVLGNVSYSPHMMILKVSTTNNADYFVNHLNAHIVAVKGIQFE
jgi:hypothetical protein